MFKRKILLDIEKWKERNSRKKKALIIKGLRQVGKTYIVDYFAKENYESIIYINFKSNPEYKTIFNSSLEVDSLKINISATIKNSKFIDNDTVIILDEIQECNNARTSLKNFCLDGRYDVICTGSLLGIKGYNRQLSQGPSTGYEEFLTMKAMDFEEFLWAIGIDETVTNKLKEFYNNKETIDEAINVSMKQYFKEYICVGGMPAVIEEYIYSHDLNAVLKVQRDLVNSYIDDFGKHIDITGKESINNSLLSKINTVFESIPSQLAKENNKFVYKELGSHARKSMYEEAIDWLISFGLVVPCYNLKTLELPLEGNKDKECFKLYFSDTGLFVSQLEDGTQKRILDGSLKIYKGAIYENIVADAFWKADKNLYYFRKSSGLEIDFVTKVNDELSIIEVKARSGRSKSMNEIINNTEKYHVEHAYKLDELNINTIKNKTTLPQYMAYLLK